MLDPMERNRTKSEVCQRKGCYFIQDDQGWDHDQVTFEQTPEEVTKGFIWISGVKLTSIKAPKWGEYE